MVREKVLHDIKSTAGADASVDFDLLLNVIIIYFYLLCRLFGSVAKSCMQKQPQTVGGGASQSGREVETHD